jgi:hypothetical protein
LGILRIKNVNMALLAHAIGGKADFLPGQTDNPFNKKLGWVFGVAQNYNIASLRITDFVSQPVDY